MSDKWERLKEFVTHRRRLRINLMEDRLIKAQVIEEEIILAEMERLEKEKP